MKMNPSARRAGVMVAAWVVLAAWVAAGAAEPPKDVVGKWRWGSISPTTFWDGTTGVFQGNGRSMAVYYDFRPDGTFTRYTYLEVRMYSIVTTVWTSIEGKASFEGDTFKLAPTKGHTKTSTGSRKSDRDLTEKELKEMTDTYKWKLVPADKSDDGRPHFVIPFDDGSQYDLTPDDAK